VRNLSKYLPLVKDVSNMTAWKPLLFTIKIGVRGFIAISTRQVFLKLRLPAKLLNEVLNRLSIIAATCSYTIFLASNSITWAKSQLAFSHNFSRLFCNVYSLFLLRHVSILLHPVFYFVHMRTLSNL